MSWRFVLTAFFMAHAAIQFSFVSPAPTPTPGAPAWPFDLSGSWLLGLLGAGGSATRGFGVGLLLLLSLGYAAAALVTIGVLPEQLSGASVILGATASLVLLTLFFHPWLALGVVIDLVLLALVLATGWAPRWAGS